MDLIRGKLRTKQGKKEETDLPILEKQSSSKRELYRDGRSSSESILQKSLVVSDSSDSRFSQWRSQRKGKSPGENWYEERRKPVVVTLWRSRTQRPSSSLCQQRVCTHCPQLTIFRHQCTLQPSPQLTCSLYVPFWLFCPFFFCCSLHFLCTLFALCSLHCMLYSFNWRFLCTLFLCFYSVLVSPFDCSLYFAPLPLFFVGIPFLTCT